MRRQFMATYEEAIRLIKDLKASNDTLNRSIGVDPISVVSSRLKTENLAVQSIIKNIDILIVQLEQSYLDPDTARKIGNAKQQYRIQKDRRNHLLQTVEQERPRKNSYSKRSVITEGSFSEETSVGNSEGPSHLRERRESQDMPERGIEMQGEEISYEMDHKMIQQRSQDIDNMSKHLLNVHNIINETSVLTYQQGEQIDIIGEDLFEAYKGVREAREHLEEAEAHQKKAKQKYVVMSLVLLLVVAVVIILMMA